MAKCVLRVLRLRSGHRSRRVGCRDTSREGSGVSGCLLRRGRTADTANPQRKRRRVWGETLGHPEQYVFPIPGGGLTVRTKCSGESEGTSNGEKGGGNPLTTGMARDYDYLFKLLIIGDSGKARPGMWYGKWACSGVLG